MRKNGFGNLLVQSILATWGSVVSIISILAIVVSYFAAPADDVIHLRWYLITVFFCLFLIITFARASWLAFLNSSPPPPKVKYAKEPPLAFKGAHALLLVEQTSLLAHDALVTIYYLEDEIERLVGLGKVINVQNNGKIQILVTANIEFGEKLAAIKSNSVDELKRIIIKTSIPGYVLEAHANG
jgi:hypothetical protein